MYGGIQGDKYLVGPSGDMNWEVYCCHVGRTRGG